MPNKRQNRPGGGFIPWDIEEFVQAVPERAAALGRRMLGTPERPMGAHDPGARAAAGVTAAMRRTPPVLRGPQRPDPVPRGSQRSAAVPSPSRTPNAPAEAASTSSSRLQWPLQGRYDLNPHVPAVAQGDGRYGYTREGGKKFHGGIDIAAPVGTPVYAAADGKVFDMAPFNRSGTFGHQVVIDHGDGLCTQYAHLDEPGAVQPGASVRAGTRIGTVGRTGNVGKAASHLHLEVRPKGCLPRGKTANPYDYMPPNIPRR